MQRLTVQCSCGASFVVTRSDAQAHLGDDYACPGRQLLGCTRRFKVQDLFKAMNKFIEVYYVEGSQENLEL